MKQTRVKKKFRISRDEKTARNKKRFLAVQRHCLSINAACEKSGIPAITVWEWRKKDEPFAQAVLDALAEAADSLEEEARRRAVEGWQEPVIHQGQLQFRHDPLTGKLELDDNFEPIPLTVTKKSDRLLEVMLSAKKNDYKRKGFTFSTGSGEGGQSVPSKITVEFIGSDGDGRPKNATETHHGAPVEPESTS